MIAALYVQTGGCYYGLPNVDPWDKERDARLYAGPWPVVAHPPCERWGRYWSGGPSAKVRRKRGDDGGCFAAALEAVIECGGVLEHPADSSAWKAFGLIPPLHTGGWSVADDCGGWTCRVEQGHFGHRARKATWLYANGVVLPSLPWGGSGRRARIDLGFHSAEERRAFRANRSLTPELARKKRVFIDAEEAATGKKHFRRLSAKERAATPLPFRDLLISIAESARKREAA